MPITFTKTPEEIEIIHTPEGTRIIEICNTCIAEEGADEFCKPSALFYVQALIKGGHVKNITDPGDETPC